MRKMICNLCSRSFCNNCSYFGDPVEVLGDRDDTVCWTSKISYLVRKKQSQEAIGEFKMMLFNEIRPNYITILSVIRGIGELDMENMTREIHCFAIKIGLETDISVATALIGIYSVQDLVIVRKLFDKIPNKDVILLSAVVSACAKRGYPVEAFDLFREMQFFSICPNYVTIISVLPACANLGALSCGKEIHGFSIKRPFCSLTTVQNSLVDMYAKCGNLKNSIQVFNGILKKDIVSWKTMIRGCITNDCPIKALTYFSQMRTYSFQLDETIIGDMVGVTLEADEPQWGLTFHSLLLKKGFLAFVSIGTSLLQMYAKFGIVGSARILFDQLIYKDLIAWSSMISVYAQSENPFNALDIFKQMQSANEKPNEITFVSLLQAFASMRAQELGEIIQAHVTKSGHLSNPFLSSSLIDLYCKVGRINEGKCLFNQIPIKDLICWSSMINGYGINGYGNDALATFSRMLNCGIKPNEVTFVSVLSACSHCGLEYEGWSLFYSMEENYHIIPKLAHYACMVDLLSRRGNVEEALKFVDKMPLEPDKRIWGAILAGCRLTRGSLKIAEFVAKRLIELDKENPSYYVILSNLYAEEGRWGDMEKMRKYVDAKGLKKTIGYSMVEAN